MDKVTIVAVASIISSAAAITLGVMVPAIGEMKVLVKAIEAIAQQPDASAVISRNLFIGIAMIESLAIYCLVISIILIYTNPFWAFVTTH